MRLAANFGLILEPFGFICLNQAPLRIVVMVTVAHDERHPGRRSGVGLITLRRLCIALVRSIGCKYVDWSHRDIDNLTGIYLQWLHLWLDSRTFLPAIFTDGRVCINPQSFHRLLTLIDKVCDLCTGLAEAAVVHSLELVRIWLFITFESEATGLRRSTLLLSYKVWDQAGARASLEWWSRKSLLRRAHLNPVLVSLICPLRAFIWSHVVGWRFRLAWRNGLCDAGMLRIYVLCLSLL